MNEEANNGKTHTLEEPFSRLPVLGSCRCDSSEVVVSEEVEVGESVELLWNWSGGGIEEMVEERGEERQGMRDRKKSEGWEARIGESAIISEARRRCEGRDDGERKREEETHVLEDALQLSRGDLSGVVVILAHDARLFG